MWNMLSNNWLLLTAVAVVLLILWIIAVLSKYMRLMLNIIRDSPPPLLIGPFDFEHVEGHHVSFRAYDGTALRGMFLTADYLDPQASQKARSSAAPSYLSPATRGVIVFCHEFGSDMYSCIRYCEPLLRAGFTIFTFDFRSHGRSVDLPGYTPRLWCTDKEVSDCLGAVTLVHSELADRHLDLNIALFGISRGASAALLTAQHPHLPTPISAVIADSPFSTDATLERFMKKWVHIFARVRFMHENHPAVYWRFIRWMLLKFARIRFNCSFPSVRKALAHLRLPVFFIHGQKDSYIKPQQTRILFRRTRPPRYLWIVPDAKHNQAVIAQPDRYAGRTVTFFEKYLTAPDIESHTTTLAAELKQDAVDFFTPAQAVCRPRSASRRKKELAHAKQNHKLPRRRHHPSATASLPAPATPMPDHPAKPARDHPTHQSGK